MVDKDIERWCDKFIGDPNRPVVPVLYNKIMPSQTFLHEDRVEFYRQCIRLGCFPPPIDAIETDQDGLCIPVDGHHRARAWFLEGFQHIPTRLQTLSEG